MDAAAVGHPQPLLDGKAVLPFRSTCRDGLAHGRRVNGQFEKDQGQEDAHPQPGRRQACTTQIPDWDSPDTRVHSVSDATSSPGRVAQARYDRVIPKQISLRVETLSQGRSSAHRKAAYGTVVDENEDRTRNQSPSTPR
jgi:hypothetical protein